MRRREGELAVGSLCKPVGKAANLWREGSSKLLRVAKRRSGRGWISVACYFCVGVGDPVGHGVWLGPKEVRALSPLELLAMVAKENEEC